MKTIGVLARAAGAAIRERAFAPPPSPVDWNAVVSAAEELGVTVLVARVLHEHMPADVATRLDANVRAKTDRALRITRQLRQLLDIFAEQGIDVLPIKGPLLAASVYGDVARRGASADLDLIVRKSDLPRAVTLLETRGYQRVEESIDAHDHEAWESEAHLYPTAGGVLVELHSELIGNFDTEPLQLEAVLARCTTEQWFGTTVRVPAAEDLLLYLCLHGARHMWSRLLWVCDIAAMLRSARIDWPLLIARADSIDARTRLAHGLHLAAELLGAPIPDGARPLLQTRLVRLRARIVARRMRETAAGQQAPRFVTRLLSEIAARETTQQLGTYVRTQLEPNARDRAWVRLPRMFEWLRYLIRPVRLLASYGQGIRRRNGA